MPVAALYGKTVREYCKAPDYLDYGGINRVDIQFAQIFLPLLMEMRVLNEVFKSSESLQLYHT